MKPTPPVGSLRHDSFRRGLAGLLAVMTILLLGGCGALRPQKDPTRFYVLTLTATNAVSRTVGEGEPKRLQVALKPVELARYLQSRSIVVRTGANEVRFAEFDRWAEPLDQAIARVLKENLGHAPNVAGVAVNPRGDATPDCEVVIRILACEGVRMASGTGSVRFEATWEVRHLGANPAPAKSDDFKAETMAWDGQDYGQLAGRLSEAVAAAANAIAADLQEGGARIDSAPR